ncbi:hypothetical protein KIN20_015950 [Parelaphostrongylus tenuis]|uniref:Uncharacterized protein n=1 Tax=Parelaphostrongylus tenuis TaxID=148309 RepID=A0AAD5MJA5_PARTN|nr:hypothetical protein KIN20_015950 [Parelaphostrongylus tenuis]
MRLAEMEGAATTIQKAFRHHTLRKKMREERCRMLAGRERASITIQKAFRRYSYRKQMRQERRRRLAEMEGAAATIQKAFRRYSHRKKMREERQKELAKMKEAAATIQRAFCGYSLRKKMREERRRKLAEMEEAATTIQRAFCRYSLRKKMREERRRRLAEMEEAATTIQKAFYRYSLRKKMREERRRRLAEMDEAATTIQRAFRRYSLRKKMREERRRRLAEMQKAATTIQEVFRHYSHRKQMREERRKKLAEREQAAAVIQKAFRHYVLREKMREERQRRLAEMEGAAAIIQKSFRHYLHRKKLCEEHQRRLAEMEKAATLIQSWMRMVLARRALNQLRENQMKYDLARLHAAVVIQAYIRGALARRKFSQLSQQRKCLIQNVIRIQRCVRVFLARRKLRQELAERKLIVPEGDDIFEDTQEPTSSTWKEDNFNDFNRIRELQYKVRENERRQKLYSSILKACERQLSENSDDGENLIEKQVEQYCCVPSIHDQTTAAARIQAWYRGCRERARLRVHLQERRTFMDTYRRNIAAEQPSSLVDNDTLSSRPVLTKMHDAVDMLFDPKMYVSKVGAFILNRLSALSPHLCAYMVVEAQGLASILDILEQKSIGRGPPTANVLVVLQEVFLRIVECKHPLVVAEVDAQLEGCVKAALHTFHAFHTDPVIVDGFGRAILALYRRSDAKKYFEKAPFYLDYATRRFNRLPETDPRKAILLRMKEEMSQ